MLEQILATGAICVCVTFIDALSRLGDKTVSMVSTVMPDDPAIRTFQIIRKPADGLAYALSLAQKRGVTYEQLRTEGAAMKTFLMHPSRILDADSPPKGQTIPFAQDIELEVLLSAAAGGDRYLRDVLADACADAWANDVATIRYRQEIVKDCLANPAAVRQFYALAIEPFGRERSWDFSLYGHDPSSMVGSAVRTLQQSLEVTPQAKEYLRRQRQ